MNYTLHQLILFLKITETKSITRASEELNLTQPAVSIQLKNFQDQFDIPLTETIGRQIYITDFGYEIAESAKKILDELKLVNYKTQNYKGLLTGDINISVVSTGKYIMPYFLTDFFEEHPQINFKLDVTNRLQVLEDLQKNKIDFALVSVLPENLDVESIELMENKLYFVGSNSIKKNDLNFDELQNYNLLFREQGSATRKAMENFLKKNKISHQKTTELASNEAIKQAVIAKLGISIMPIIGLKNELLNDELKILNVKNLPSISTWYLIHLKNKSLSPAAEAYKQFISINKTKVIQEQFNWITKF